MYAGDFAIVDVETTGFSPRMKDRVIEIAVVRANLVGEIHAQYHTLLNPERDVGPTHVHGIAAGDVLAAPRFSEICGDILELLRDAVFVAHNAHFDLRFLQSEFKFAQCELPSIPVLCTLKLARRVCGQLPCRKLPYLCQHFGISQQPDHMALHDAIAVMHLLYACIREMGIRTPALSDLDVFEVMGSGGGWPTVKCSGKAFTRLDAVRREKEVVPYLARLVGRATSMASPRAEWDSYLSILDRALEDRRVTKEEVDELDSLAREAGLSHADIAGAHLQYLKELVSAAWADGKITDAEVRDLADVARLLCVDSGVCDAMLDIVAMPDSGTDGESHMPLESARTENVAGKSVCFTGVFQCRIAGESISRERACGLAAESGMIVKNSVSRMLDYLVVADPDSLSSKARNAREKGVRIIAERVFWRMLGYDVE